MGTELEEKFLPGLQLLPNIIALFISEQVGTAAHPSTPSTVREVQTTLESIEN